MGPHRLETLRVNGSQAAAYFDESLIRQQVERQERGASHEIDDDPLARPSGAGPQDGWHRDWAERAERGVGLDELRRAQRVEAEERLQVAPERTADRVGVAPSSTRNPTISVCRH